MSEYEAWEAGWDYHFAEVQIQKHDPTHPITRDNPYPEPRVSEIPAPGGTTVKIPECVVREVTRACRHCRSSRRRQLSCGSHG